LKGFRRHLRGLALYNLVHGFRGSLPSLAHIVHLSLYALHLKPDASASREMESNKSARRGQLFERNRQQLGNRERLAGPDFLTLRPFYPVEAQGASAPAQIGMLAVAVFGGEPIETAHDRREMLLGRHIHHVGQAQYGILQVSGQDFEIVVIESYELERFWDTRAHDERLIIGVRR
jgi:hypothetical protein